MNNSAPFVLKCSAMGVGGDSRSRPQSPLVWTFVLKWVPPAEEYC